MITRLKQWRREPESNRPTWICNPVHNRFAIAPKTLQVSMSADAAYLPDADKQKLERERRLELPTPTLARLCSTN